MTAVALSPSRHPGLVDRPDPRPAADEVVIRPHYCGICGSDLHAKNVCHRCAACSSGRANLSTVATLERPAGVARDGGMAELVALHTSYLQPLPDSLDTRRAAWTKPRRPARAAGPAPRRHGPGRYGRTIDVPPPDRHLPRRRPGAGSRRGAVYVASPSAVLAGQVGWVVRLTQPCHAMWCVAE